MQDGQNPKRNEYHRNPRAGTPRTTYENRQRQRRRREKRRRAIRNHIIAGLVVLALIVAIIVLLVKNWGKGEPDVSEPPIVSTPPQSTVSLPAVVDEPSPYADSPYYEEAAPLLTNRWNPLPDDYAVETASVGYRDNGAEQFMETRAAAAFLAMQGAAKEEGITLMAYSGYREHARQVNNYNASINRYLGEGKTQEEAERLTQAYYAIPGTSEHEAGLAMDINGIENSFENTPPFAWLAEHAAEYGFILRYPKDTQEITGIAYEPWHYRYVGINHAMAMRESGETLEEYVAGLKEE